MKALLAVLFFLSTSTIALGEETLQATVIQPMTVSAEAPSPIAEVKSALADCIQQTVHDVTPQAMLVVYPALLLLLRLLSEALGKLALAGSSSASAAVVGIRYLTALLGWFFGKSGWGAPKASMVQKMPSLKDMKAKAKAA